MKKILFTLSTALFALIFVYGVFVNGAEAQTFTRDLTIGSTGSDVIALQDILISKGYLVLPVGASKEYFGALTKAAVAKWQAAVGISPADGYFGVMSRSKLSIAPNTTFNIDQIINTLIAGKVITEKQISTVRSLFNGGINPILDPEITAEQPTLELKYDSNKKESQVVGKQRIVVVARNQDVVIQGPDNIDYGRLTNTVTKSYVSSYVNQKVTFTSNIKKETNGTFVIKKGQLGFFDAVYTVPAAEMLAGKYEFFFNYLYILDNQNPGMVKSIKFDTPVSNAVTVVGEDANKYETAEKDAQISLTYDGQQKESRVTGRQTGMIRAINSDISVRFSPQLKNENRNDYSVSYKNANTNIMFQGATKKDISSYIIKAGTTAYYDVSVAVPAKDLYPGQHTFFLEIIVNDDYPSRYVTTKSKPITVIGENVNNNPQIPEAKAAPETGVLSLSYDSNKKESLLSGKQIVNVAAGSQDVLVFNLIPNVIGLNPNTTFNNIKTSFSGISNTKLETYKEFSVWRVKAGQTAKFETKLSVPAGDLYAGTYTMILRYAAQMYGSQGETSIIPSKDGSSNQVVVIGEDANKIMCPKIYRPVCGSDGKTYGNSCEADAAKVTYKDGACSILKPVNGACAATTYACVAGIISQPSVTVSGDYWKWTCVGSSGGTTASCQKEICAGAAVWNGSACVSTPVICTTEYKPVCGSDGKTYSNKCNAEAAKVTYKDGACPAVSPLSIKITAPTVGENLTLGQTYRIKWDSSKLIDKVTLGYSFGEGSMNWMDNNASYNMANTGYYDWKVNIGNTTNTKVRFWVIGYQTGVGSVDSYSDYFNVLPVTSSPTIPVVRRRAVILENGLCGASNNTCTTGRFVDEPDTDNQSKWSCSGSNGGTTVSCSIPATSTPVSINTNLKPGQTGSEVTLLQQTLKNLGYYSDEVTGFFGNITKGAVSQFQTANALEAVGEVGPKTRQLLNSMLGF